MTAAVPTIRVGTAGSDDGGPGLTSGGLLATPGAGDADRATGAAVASAPVVSRVVASAADPWADTQVVGAGGATGEGGSGAPVRTEQQPSYAAWSRCYNSTRSGMFGTSFSTFDRQTPPNF